MRMWITQAKNEHSNMDHALEFAGMTYENKYSVYFMLQVHPVRL